MPKISLIPDLPGPITGDERVVANQGVGEDEVTGGAPLSALVNAAVAPAVAQAQQSASEAASALAGATNALGRFVDAGVTIEGGFYNAYTGAAFDAPTFAAWLRWQRPGREGDVIEVDTILNSDQMSAISFFDEAGDRVGDPIILGINDSLQWRRNVRAVYPPGAVLAKGSGWAFDDVIDGQFVRARIFVRVLALDPERAATVAEAIDSARPWVDQEVELQSGFYNWSTGMLNAPAGALEYVVLPIEERSWVRLFNAVKVDNMAAIVFASHMDEDGHFLDPEGRYAVTGAFDIGNADGPTRVDEIPRQAPARSRFVAFGSAAGRNLRIQISEPEGAFARKVSDLISTLNPYRGKKLLWDADSLGLKLGVAGGVPERVAYKLGATVFNRSIGGSNPRNGSFLLRGGPDAIGLTGYPYQSVRVFQGCTLAELIQRREDWDFWRTRIPDAPDEISDEEFAVWAAACLDNNFIPFLDDADVLISAHGHNAGMGYVLPDAANWATFTGTVALAMVEGQERPVLTVTDHAGASIDPGMRLDASTSHQHPNWTGWYIADRLAAPTGGNGTYTLFGGSDTDIAATPMVAKPYLFGWNDEMKIIPGITPGYTQYARDDRGFYIGSMLYRHNLWRTAREGKGWMRPEILKGYYASDWFKANIVLAQKVFAEYSGIPVTENWRHLRWSQQVISSGPDAGKTMLKAAMPDELHHYTDETGWASDQDANVTVKQMLMIGA